MGTVGQGTSRPSARSLLFTVLGEYLRWPGRQIWTASLVAALAQLGVGEAAARQALTRTARAGWAQPVRHGRRIRWRLTPAALAHLGESADEVYRRRRHPPAWDGSWLLLMTSVPETRRDLRHRLRTRLRWAGFGALGQGVWLSPRGDAERLARRVLTELDLSANGVSVRGQLSGLGSEYEVVHRAWNLTALARDYDGFLTELPPASADASARGAAAFAAHTLMVHRWREFALRDPVLPARLLPACWPGHTAADRFYQRHDALYPTALGWLAALDRGDDMGDISLQAVTQVS